MKPANDTEKPVRVTTQINPRVTKLVTLGLVLAVGVWVFVARVSR
jgi:hypothetical protein